jgi:hypothetical protein
MATNINQQYLLTLPGGSGHFKFSTPKPKSLKFTIGYLTVCYLGFTGISKPKRLVNQNSNRTMKKRIAQTKKNLKNPKV